MLTQSEYTVLMSQHKVFEDSEIIYLGPAPARWTRLLKSLVGSEVFRLDFHRGRLELRYTYNLRRNLATVLFRYDHEGIHTNPDGVRFSGPHIHLYTEGYDDKFAFSVSQIGVLPTDNISEVLVKVANFCNIINVPTIQVPAF
jgi:hypothetical protein